MDITHALTVAAGADRVYDALTTQDGIAGCYTPATKPEPYDAFSSFNYPWGQYIRSIRLYAETGTGEAFGTAASKAAGTTP